MGRQAGFSLVEVLVSLLVVSVGMLGLAWMQIAGMRHNQNAYLQSQASLVISDLTDRMRANPDGVAGGGYDSISTANLPADPACISDGCSPAALAQEDVRQWGGHLTGSSALLPAASGSVSRVGDVFTIQVNWREDDTRTATERDVEIDAGADSSARSLQVRLRL